MNVRLFLPALFLIVFLCPACDSSQPETGDPGEQEMTFVPPERPCGTPLLQSVRGEVPGLGVFEVMNDTHRLWISFNHTPRFILRQVNTFIGSDFNIPRKEDGMPNAEAFNYISKSPSQDGKWSQSISLDSLPNCMTISVRVELEDQQAEAGKEVIRGWALSGKQASGFTFTYCKQSCFWTSKCKGVEQGAFTTIPLEDWLEPEGKYRQRLESDFSVAFPEGLEVGCNTGLKVAQVGTLLTMLGKEGQAKELTKDYSGSQASRLKNDLANQLCVLALNLRFDERFPEFSPSEENLHNLNVTKGEFKDWTVGEVFNEANTVIGGCTTSYSPSQIIKVLKNINANFRQGKEENAFLSCPVPDL